MKFKATIEQIKIISANAINASSPVGMGVMHYVPGDFSPEDLMMAKDDRVEMDYVQGRMVKLYIFKDGDLWSIPNGSIINPDPEYQSWAKVYPTYMDLIKSAGIKDEDIINEG